MSTIQSSAEHLTLNADGNSKDIKLQSNGSEKVIIKSDGKVGIGVTDPVMPLEIQTTGSTAAQIGLSNTGTGETGLYFDASNGDFSGSDYAWIAQNNDLSLEITTGALSNAPIILKTNDAERMRIDSSGNVGIGVTPTQEQSYMRSLNIGGNLVLEHTTAQAANGSGYLSQNAHSQASKYISTDEATSYEQKDGKHKFKVAPSGTADSAISWTDAMTITNAGDVGIGTNPSTFSAGDNAILFRRNNNTDAYVQISSNTTSTDKIMYFYNPNGQVGSIHLSGAATAYNTSSDYRLKENVDYTWDATTRLKQLKPARFNFIADDSVTVDGFIAHEVSSVVPEAISGKKDAMMDEEYEVTPAVMDGETVVTEAVMGTRSVPDYQGIDQSKLVPLLVKTIQELEARITALEA